MRENIFQGALAFFGTGMYAYQHPYLLQGHFGPSQLSADCSGLVEEALINAGYGSAIPSLANFSTHSLFNSAVSYTIAGVTVSNPYQSLINAGIETVKLNHNINFTSTANTNFTPVCVNPLNVGTEGTKAIGSITSLQVGDILLWTHVEPIKDKAGNITGYDSVQHMGIFAGYDSNLNIQFYASGSNGPAMYTMNTSGGGVWNGTGELGTRSEYFVGAFRVNDGLYNPATDNTAALLSSTFKGNGRILPGQNLETKADYAATVSSDGKLTLVYADGVTFTSYALKNAGTTVTSVSQQWSVPNSNGDGSFITYTRLFEAGATGDWTIQQVAPGGAITQLGAISSTPSTELLALSLGTATYNPLISGTVLNSPPQNGLTPVQAMSFAEATGSTPTFANPAATVNMGSLYDYTLSLSTVSSSPVTVWFKLANVAAVGSWKLVSGADKLSFGTDGMVQFTIPAGQDQVSLALVDGSNSSSPDIANLSITDAAGNIISSNNLTITFANPNPANNASTVITGQATTIGGVTITQYTGDGGGDIISGGTTGLNYITGGSGSDLITGNGGQDIIIAGNGSNRIYADKEMSLAAALAQQKATANPGPTQQGDLIAVGTGDNVIVGSGGNDLIFTDGGHNTIVMGNGANVFYGGVSATSVTVPPNWSVTQASATAETLSPNINAVATPLPNPNNTPYLGNTLLGVAVGAGNDTIFGGTGNSFYALGNGNNWLDAGGGSDTIGAGTGQSTIYGGVGNDTIFGSGGSHYINLESGNDWVELQGGHTTLIGGSGNDTICSGDTGANWATSEANGANYIYGGSGKTVIYGSGGNDTLISGSQSGGNSTTINGGSGSEYIVGGNGNDLLNGGTGSDTIYAGDGNTTITAGNGGTVDSPTYIYGGNGSDSITGGAGTDVISAGDGGTATAATEIHAGSGTSSLYGGAGVDKLYGGSGTDMLVAGTGTSTLQGGSGTEVMYSSTGNATLIAGTGNDTLYGGSGTDVLQGSNNYNNSAGTKTLFVAGSGNETITGGAGQNTYEFDAGFGNILLKGAQKKDVVFGSGISLSSLTLSQGYGSDGLPALIIADASSGSVTIDGGMSASNTYKFASGQTFTSDQLMQQGQWSAPQQADMTQVESSYVSSIQAKSTGGFVLQADGSYYQAPRMTGGISLNYTVTGQIINGVSSQTASWTFSSGTVVDSTVNLQQYAITSDASYISAGTSFLSSISYSTAGLSVSWSQSTTPSYSGYYQGYALAWSYNGVVSNIFQPGATMVYVPVVETSSTYISSVSSATTNLADSLNTASGSLSLSGTGSIPTEIPVNFIHAHQTNLAETINVAGTGRHTVVGGMVVNSGSGDNLIEGAGFVYSDSGNDTIISDDTVYTGTGNNSLSYDRTVHLGSGNDTLYACNVVYGGSGNAVIDSAAEVFFGSGNDIITNSDKVYAGSGNDLFVADQTVVAGSGNDTILGGGQGSTYHPYPATNTIIDPHTVGNVLVGGNAIDVGAALDVYYNSIGIPNWFQRYRSPNTYLFRGNGPYTASDMMNWVRYSNTNDANLSLQQMVANGDATYIAPLPVVAVQQGSSLAPSSYYASAGTPTVHLNMSANDYAALAPFYQRLVSSTTPSGLNTVSFGPGISLSDLHFSWGQVNIALSGSPNDPTAPYTTLDITWGTDNQSVRVIMPHYNDPLGSGVGLFTFADGGIKKSIVDLIALAPPAPSLDPEIKSYIFGTAMGAQTLPAGVTTIQFDPGINPASITVTQNAQGNFVISYNNGASTLTIPAQSITSFPAVATFASGTKWEFVNANGNPYNYVAGSGMVYLQNPSVVQFGAGITSNMITLGIGSLMLRVGNTGDTLHIEGFNPQDALNSTTVQSFQFADGTTLSYAQMLARGFDIYGTTGNETLTGTNLDNRIYAGTGNDVLIGSGAHDTLYGGIGNDTLMAGSGTDLLIAGAGLATMIGGTGNDTFVVNNVNDIVQVGAVHGNDTIQTSVSYTASANVQNLTGTGTANITLTGNNLNNVITANSGNDTLIAGSGIATMIGGAGNDTFVVNNVNDVVIAQAGSVNTVQTSVSYVAPANVQNLTGTGMADITLTGNDLANTLTANSGNDTLIAGSGVATMIGGAGNDTFVVNNVNDVVIAQAGSVNTVQTSVSYVASANVQNLTGTGMADITLTGNDLANTLTANSGNDTLIAGAGVATMIGGAGNDTFVVNNTADVVQAQSTGSNVNTVLTSVSYVTPANVQNLTGTGTADITLTGNDLANVITANSGNDTLIAGAGVATMIGGAGNDTFIVDNTADIILAQLTGSNVNTAYSSVDYALATNAQNVQNLTGTGTANITLSGNSLDNTLTANSGNDTLISLTGNDTLISGAGVDTMVGGTGNDVFVVNNSADLIQAQLTGSNVNSAYSSVNYDMAANARNVQNLTGAGSADLILTGNSLDNVITANSGNDLLVSVGGNDTLVGGIGADVLDGGAGNNVLTDTQGQGILLGGAGTDTLTGGGGNSFLAGGAGNDFVTPGIMNSIVAFNAGDGADTIMTAAGGANTLSLGGAINFSSLALARNGNDLILSLDANDSVTFHDWYASSANHDFSTLQIIGQQMSPNNHVLGGVVGSKANEFDFGQIVALFDQQTAHKPPLSPWNMTNALLLTHLASSDTTALGGDLAYYYGSQGSLSGMNLAAAQGELQSLQFGVQQQTINSWPTLNTGTAQIK